MQWFQTMGLFSARIRISHWNRLFKPWVQLRGWCNDDFTTRISGRFRLSH